MKKKLTKLKTHPIQIIIISVNLALKSINFGTKYFNDHNGQIFSSEIVRQTEIMAILESVTKQTFK